MKTSIQDIFAALWKQYIAINPQAERIRKLLKLRGEEVNSGVFVYWARVEFIDGEFLIFKGDVTLAR